jgi:hypothetical protein
MRKCAVLAVVLGCGGSSKQAQDPAAAAREAERKRIEAMRPPSPYETRAVVGYRSPATCGQGPYRIEAAALGARFGERIEVNICAPRSLQGDYRFTVGTDPNEPRHFGSRNNSEHCMATAADAARRDAAGPSASSSTAAAPPATPAAKTTRPSSEVATPLALTAVGERVGETCPTGMYLTGIVDYGTISTSDHVPWKPGTARPMHHRHRATRSNRRSRACTRSGSQATGSAIARGSGARDFGASPKQTSSQSRRSRHRSRRRHRNTSQHHRRRHRRLHRRSPHRRSPHRSLRPRPHRHRRPVRSRPCGHLATGHGTAPRMSGSRARGGSRRSRAQRGSAPRGRRVAAASC